MQQENPYQVFTYLGANGLEMIISNIAKEGMDDFLSIQRVFSIFQKANFRRHILI
jgi:hypothetical protein